MSPGLGVLRPLRVLYLGGFGILGAVVPFLAAELGRRGVDGLAFVALMAALPLGRLVAGPVWGSVADAWGDPLPGLRVGAVLTTAGLVALALSSTASPGLLALGGVLFAVGYAPVGPLSDAVALRVFSTDPGAYGGLRLWGSAGYFVASLAVGFLVDLLPGVPLLAGALLGTVVLGAGLSLPRAEAPDAAAVKSPALDLKDPLLLTILVAATLHFTVHVATSSLLDLHFRSLGHSSAWTGVALAAGVFVEVAVMSQGRFLLERLGARTVFRVALALAALRWLAMTQVTAPLGIVAVQASHGVTFGAFWLAAVALVDQAVGPTRRARGQAVLSAAIGGVGALVGITGGAALVEATDTFTLFGVGVVIAVLAAVVSMRTLRRP